MADESDHPVGGGLITQRMRAERGLGTAIFWLGLGMVWMVLTVSFLLDPPQEVWQWVGLVGPAGAGVIAIGYGILQLRARAKRIAAFNAEHGVDAGRQSTV